MAPRTGSKSARKATLNKRVVTEEGKGVLSWLSDNRLVVYGMIGAVLSLAAAQFVFLISGYSLFGSGIQNFDLAGDGVIRAALVDGEPWVIFCDQDSIQSGSPRYRKSREVFMEAASVLAASSAVRVAQMDCSRRLEKSGKSVFSALGLPPKGLSPATVIVAANGRKPSAVPAPFLTSRKKLLKYVAKRTALDSMEILPGKSLRKCLRARSCVVVAHSGSVGRRPVKAVVADMMAAHRTVQFATLDTSKAWLSGLPQELVAVLPRPSQQPAAVSRQVAGRGGRVRSVSVEGLGSGNAASDGEGQVVLVLQRDPRRAAHAGDKAGRRLGRGLIVTWKPADDAAGGGGGRLLVSRGDINAAVKEAVEAAERAKAAGGLSGGRTVADVLTAVAGPQLDQERAGSAVASQILPIKAPPMATAASRGRSQELRRKEALDKSARRRAERDLRREGGGAGGDDADDADVRRQRAREAMEREAKQWVPEAVSEDGGDVGDDYGELYEEDDEEDAGFVVVEAED